MFARFFLTLTSENPKNSAMTHGRHFYQLCIVVAVTLVLSSCGSFGPANPDLEVAVPVESSYDLTVTSGAGNITYRGKIAKFDISIGYLRLGPEEVTSGPIASFSALIQQSCINFDTLTFSRNCTRVDISFYSIEFPGNVLGEQNAINYTPISIDSISMDFGRDSRGLIFVRGHAIVKFESIPPVIGERLPEEITVSAVFVVLEG